MMASIPLLLVASALAINHQPVDCFVKDTFARLEVDVQPPMAVSGARLFFRSERTDEFHYVPMTLMFSRFTAKLPRPRERAGTITYYLEITAADGALRKTAEIAARVVRDAAECPEGGRVADVADEGDIRIWTAGKSRSKPKDFSGIDRVLADRDGAAPAGESPGDVIPPSTAGAPAVSTPLPQPQPAAAAPRPIVDDTGEYAIGAEDIVKVTVMGHEDLTQAIVVQPDGTFIYPLIGRVKAADLTPKELERKITTLLAQGFVRNPQVTVSVQEYRSKTVFVVGEVSRPGSYALSGRMTVLELLSKAGPTSAAGVEVVIVRPKVAVQGPVIPADITGGAGGDASDIAKQADLIRVNIRDIQMGQLDKNVLVKPNDTVFVTQAARIFVTGEVRTPGAITYWPGATVRMAINTAGGFSADAASGRIRVVRQVEGKAKELKIGLDDVVEPGDTIIVKAKRF
jgi:polysaccharide biosynthesis/export protein